MEFPRQLDVIPKQGCHFVTLPLSEMSRKMITQAENCLESTQVPNGANIAVTNFIWPYLHQFFIDSHSLNGYRKPLKGPFNKY